MSALTAPMPRGIASATQNHGARAAHAPAILLSGREKAAVIVRLLLSEGDGVPLRGLPDHLQEALTEQMGSMRSVDRATLRAVVEEFLIKLDSVGLSFPGGIAAALAMLDGHISPAAATRVRRLAGDGAARDPWETIAALDTEKLLPILGEESVEVGAVVLSKISVPRAAEILGKLPGAQARRLAFAIGQTGNIDPETVHQIGISLAAQFESRPVRAFEAAPHERVGAILNIATAAIRDEVLNGLGDEDADFAAEVRKSIFTFADIPARIEARDIAKVIRGIEQPTLITALAGVRTPEETEAAEFILANMSQRMATSLREEMAERGKIREKDAEAAMTQLVIAIRDLETAGDITLKQTETEEDE